MNPRPPTNLPADSLGFALLRAAGVVVRVFGGANLTESLARCWRENPAIPVATRGAVQDLAYGVLRRQGLGDFLLGKLLHRPLSEPLLRALLLAALHRLEARPEDAHTTVNQAVLAASTLQNGALRGLTNAVLRGYQRRREELLSLAGQDEVVHWQHPRWWLSRLKGAYPADWSSILAAGNGHPPMTLRVNVRRISPETYRARLAEEGIACRVLQEGALLLERPQPVDRLPGFFEGLVSVQDAGAQRAAALLDLADGQRVLDACAAPGGKTAHILEMARVEMTALDADAGRLSKVEENLTRLGLTARTLAADCRELSAWWDGQAFQRILADVPCSASGVVRRHPDIKWLRREADIAGFAAVQSQILDALWQTLASGGKLLYATCSVFDEENEAQVAAFARRHADCLRVPVSGALSVQLLPRDDHDGFFYALLQKRA